MNIILFKDQRIRFNCNVEGDKHEPIFAKMEDWFTPKGLIIPLSRGAVEVREFLRDPTYEPDRVWEETVCAMLVSPNGRMFDVEFAWVIDDKRLRSVSVLARTEPGAIWVNSYARRKQETGQVLIHFYDDLSTVIDELNNIVPMMLDGYEEWDYEALVKHVAAEVERLYPSKPETAPGG